MSESDYDVEDLSAEPIGPDHLYEYVMSHHHDERLAKLATGVNLARRSSSGLGELTAENNLSKLREEYDVTYSELLDGARNWQPDITPQRALASLDGQKGTLAKHVRDEWEQRAEETDESTTTETVPTVDTTDELSFNTDKTELGQYLSVKLAGRCGLMSHEWVRAMMNLAEGCEEHGYEPDDIVMCPREVAEAGGQLRAELTREAGIPEKEARELSISSLKRIAGDGNSLSELEPAPRSGDAQSSDVTRYSDPETAEELIQRIEYIENHSSGGELMKQQQELYEEKLAELEA